jgi:TP901 family phage tail tape measure protein
MKVGADPAKITALSNSIIAAKNNVTALEASLASAKNTPLPVDAAKVTALTAQLQLAKDKVDAVKAALDTAKAGSPADPAKVAQLTQDLTVLASIITSIKTSLDSAKNTPLPLDTARITALKDELVKARKELIDLGKTKPTSGSSQDLAAFQQKVADAKAKIVALNSELKNAQKPQYDTTLIANLSNDLSDAKKYSGELNKELKAAQKPVYDTASINQLTWDYQEAKKEVTLLNGEITKAQKPVYDTAGIAQLKVDLAAAKQVVADLEQELAKEKKLNFSAGDIQAVEKQLVAAKMSVMGLTAQIQAATPVTTSFLSSISKLSSAGLKNLQTSLGNTFAGITKFGSILKDTKSFLMSLTDTFRLVAQGVTNLGRSLFFFVTIPVVGFLSGVLKSALNFEDTMTQVSRTTRLTGESLNQLALGIRAIATHSRTSLENLASVSVVLGQAGVTSVKALTIMTQAFDMFAIGTDTDLATVTDKVVKFSNAFGWNLNNAQTDVWKFLNVVNLLAKSTAATADDILIAATDFAAYAKFAGMSAAQTAAWAAVLPSLGLSATEAGTALKNAISYAATNADKISAVMGPLNKAYDTTAKVVDALGKNASNVFADIMDAADHTSNSVTVLTTLIDIFNRRGGNGMVVVANNTLALKDALKMANDEWNNATSLVVDYAIAMSSTKAQIGIFQNNIKEAGIVISGTLLPMLNKLLQIAVPGLQMIMNAFNELSSSQKMNIILWTGIALVAGPVLMFVGQLVHAIILIMWGFVSAVGWIGTLISAFGSLGTALLSVANIGTVAFVGISAGLLKVLDVLGVNVRGFFTGLAGKILIWGENLAASLANGFLAGAVRYVTSAVSQVANYIASFFEAHSPPKAGPLSTIDKWGAALMQSYLGSFMEADFSILSDVGSIIKDALTAGVEDEALPDALRKVAGARNTIAAVIAKFNETGIIDSGMIDSATSGLGDIAGNVKELITLSLQYNQVQQKLADIEKQRQAINDGYEAQISSIASSNQTITDKVEGIRNARMQKDNSLKVLDKEEQKLKDQADALKANLNIQKSIIDAMQEQKSIFTEIAAVLKRLEEEKKKEKTAETTTSDFGTGAVTPSPAVTTGSAPTDFSKTFDELNKKWTTGRAILQGFIDAWNGVKPKTAAELGLTGEDYDQYMALFKIGTKAAGVRNSIMGVVEAFQDLTKAVSALVAGDIGVSTFLLRLGVPPGIVQGYNELAGALKNLSSGSMPTGITDGLNAMQPVINAIGVGLAFIGAVFSSVFAALSPVIQAAGAQFAMMGVIIWDTLVAAFTALQPAMKPLGVLLTGVLVPALLVLVGVITGALASAISFWSTNWLGLIELFSGLANVLTGVVGLITGFVQVIVGVTQGLTTGNWENVSKGWQSLWDGISNIVKGATQVIVGLFDAFVMSIVNALSSFVDTFLGFFKNLYMELVGNSIVPDMMSEMFAVITSWLDQIVASVGGKIAGFGDAIQTGMRLALTNLGAMYTEFKTVAMNLIQGLADGISGSIQTVLDAVGGLGQAMVTNLKAMLGINSPSTVFAEIGRNVIAGLTEGTSGGGDVGAGIAKSLSDALIAAGAALSGMSSVIQTAISPIVDLIGTALTGAVISFSTAISTIVSPITSAAMEVGTILTTLAATVTPGLTLLAFLVSNMKDKIVASLTLYWGIIDLTWSKLWNAIVQTVNTSATLLGTILKISSRDNIALIKATIATLVFDFTAAGANILSVVTSSMMSVYGAIIRWLQAASADGASAFRSLGGVISNAMNEIISMINSKYMEFYYAGKNALQGLADGASEMVSVIIEQIHTIGQAMIDELKALLGIQSPSKVFHGIGVNMGQGLINGLAAMSDEAARTMGTFGQSLAASGIENLQGTRFPTLSMQGTSVGNITGPTVNITINDPVVREEEDIKRLAKAVSTELAKSTTLRMRYGGNVSL